MIGNDHWRKLAATEELGEVREAILTGYLEGKPFGPYKPVLALPDPLTRVLDFGCGLGRNFPYLRSIAPEVVGFDLPEMIERCRREDAARGVDLFSDWEQVRRLRFDCVFCCLVLQHIDPEECRRYLRDLAAMAPWVYVLSRGRSDFGGGVFEIIRGTGVFQASSANRVEHDPDTHGLKLCGCLGVEEVFSRADDGHYEMLFEASRA